MLKKSFGLKNEIGMKLIQQILSAKNHKQFLLLDKCYWSTNEQTPNVWRILTKWLEPNKKSNCMNKPTSIFGSNVFIIKIIKSLLKQIIWAVK